MITHVPTPRGPLSAAAGTDLSSKTIRRLVKVRLNLQLALYVYWCSMHLLFKIFRCISHVSYVAGRL